MTLGSQGYVSIVELVVYIPLGILAACVCIRHGFSKSSGWVYTVVLCLLRIIGAVCQLLTYSDHSTGLLQTTVIIDSVGISPLLLATLGMLSRLVDWANARGANLFSIRIFRVVQLVITVGLILSIVGGTQGNTNASGNVTPKTPSKVGVILYIVGFAAIVYIWLISSGHSRAVPRRESRIVLAVGLALPFIATRLAFSALSVFLHNHTFSVMGGSIVARVAMATVEEFIVTFDYVMLGFYLKKMHESEQGELVSRPWKKGDDRARSTRGGQQYDNIMERGYAPRHSRHGSHHGSRHGSRRSSHHGSRNGSRGHSRQWPGQY